MTADGSDEKVRLRLLNQQIAVGTVEPHPSECILVFGRFSMYQKLIVCVLAGFLWGCGVVGGSDCQAVCESQAEFYAEIASVGPNQSWTADEVVELCAELPKAGACVDCNKEIAILLDESLYISSDCGCLVEGLWDEDECDSTVEAQYGDYAALEAFCSEC